MEPNKPDDQTVDTADDKIQTPQSTDQITVQTTHDHTVIVKGFISGGDMEDMQGLILKHMSVKVDPKTGKMDTTSSEINGSIGLERNKKAIELLVISVDGNSDN